MAETLVRLSDHLYVHRGAINAGILKDENRALLVDPGAGEVGEVMRSLGIDEVDLIVFTHHHRDQACGMDQVSNIGTKVGVPQAERAYFDDIAPYWNDPAYRWHLYNFHPHHLMLTEPIAVHETYSEGSSFGWGKAHLSVLATPGHTDGSVSYLVDVDGQRTAFTGDLIYDEGKIFELHSLQKGNGNEITDYHGYLGARGQVVESLQRVKDARPTRIVPSHGAIMTNPSKAIKALTKRFKSCYDRYAAISALRYYFPNMFAEYAKGPKVMPILPGKDVPGCLRHFGTTWLLISQDKAAFAIDCGDLSVIQEVKKLQADRTINQVERLWITHYHDDHVDVAQAFRDVFGCSVMTDSHVADVIEKPLYWRLPCISPEAVSVDLHTHDGESWRWREFKMTGYHFPGQTYYHSGLLVEGWRGMRMFFAGDSFTMSGIDDYCAGNRNFLSAGAGFDKCIELLDKLKPDLIFNSHVEQAFDFTPEQYAFMRANLGKRKDEYGKLLAHEDPNYGIDEHWIRCYPYEQHLRGGTNVTLHVVITNHSTSPRTAECRAVLPTTWGGGVTDYAFATVEPDQEEFISLSFRIPDDAPLERYVVPVDVRYEGRLLPQVTEAIIQVF